MKKNVREFLVIVSILAAAGFFGDILAPISPWLGHFLGICCLLTAMITYCWRPESGRSTGDVLPTIDRPGLQRSITQHLAALIPILALAAYAVMFANLEPVIKLQGLILFLFTIERYALENNPLRRELQALQLTIFLFSLVMLVYNEIPQFQFIFQSMSLFLTGALGNMLHRPIYLGVSYSGLMVTVLFLLFYLSRFLLSTKRSAGFFLTGMSAALMCNILYLTLWSFWSYSSFSTLIKPARPILTGLDLRLLLFMLQLLPAYFLVRCNPLEAPPPPTSSRVWTKAAAGLAVVILSLVMLLNSYPAGSETRKDVVFYNSNLDWEKPAFGRYGLENTGMFGLLPEYLVSRGYQVRQVSQLKETELQDTGILVLINLDHVLDQNAERVIWDFVDKGGSLLVLGDHTGLDHILKPYNQLLERVHIAFRFDSAIPVRERWVASLALYPHPITRGVHANEVQVNIGASLAANSPARPLIIGRYGFSDQGDIKNEQQGYLGDMKFNPGERLGDLTLAAEAGYGRGKVLVLGDTTAFQNCTLSHSYRFVDQVFGWLARSGKIFAEPYQSIILLVFLLAFLLVFLKQFLPNPGIVLYFSLGILVVLGIANYYPASPYQMPRSSSMNTALIDGSHLNRYNLEPVSPDNIYGLITNLIRNDYFPYMMPDFSGASLDAGKLLVIIAPAKPYSTGELKAIKDYLAEGGMVLIAAGWEPSGATEGLLKEFGISIVNKPLGRTTALGEGRPCNLWSGWPVVDRDQTMQVLAEAYREPVIVFKPWGQGGVIVIGDADFLLNKNLEAAYGYDQNNILFFRDMLNKTERRLVTP